MKNEFRDKLRQKSNTKECFKQVLIEFMEKNAEEGRTDIIILEGGLTNYTNHNAEPPKTIIEKYSGISFDDIKDFFKDEEFKYSGNETRLNISWR